MGTVAGRSGERPSVPGYPGQHLKQAWAWAVPRRCKQSCLASAAVELQEARQCVSCPTRARKALLHW